MLRSSTLSCSARLEQAAMGGPPIKRAPPSDDPDAVARVQTALRELGFPMPITFAGGSADGDFGDETFRTVLAFQRAVFPDEQWQWDGQAGRHTLAQLDDALSGETASVELAPDVTVSSISTVTVPGGLGRA